MTQEKASIQYKGIEVDSINHSKVDKKVQMPLTEAVLDKILRVNEIKLSSEKVEEEVERAIIEYHQHLKYQAMSSGDYSYFFSVGTDGQLDQVREKVIRQMKAEKVIQEVIREEQLDVSPEELESEAQSLAARQQVSLEMVKDFLGENLSPLKQDLLIRKALDFICENAVIKEFGS